jgi:hypothetical protein
VANFALQADDFVGGGHFLPVVISNQNGENSAHH